MLEKLRHSVGLLGARFHFRRTRDEALFFGNSFASASSILLLMPLDGSPLYPVAPVVTMLRKHKREEQITVIVGSHSNEAFTALERSPIVRILPEEIGAFLLPRTDVLTRVRRTRYDLAIDLNLDFLLPSGYICRDSMAPVRVGFARAHADLFYNFQVQTPGTESRTVRYEQFARCLEMF